ncbi:hypothetical protein [Terrarubrum flagellatum]
MSKLALCEQIGVAVICSDDSEKRRRGLNSIAARATALENDREYSGLAQR